MPVANKLTYFETTYQDFTPQLVLAHLDVESLPLARGTAGCEPFCQQRI
jgi:hypothetical protein